MISATPGSSLMSVKVDFQEVLHTVGSDAVLFVAAFVGYLVLYYVKKAAQAKGNSKKFIEVGGRNCTSDDILEPRTICTFDCKPPSEVQNQPWQQQCDLQHARQARSLKMTTCGTDVKIESSSCSDDLISHTPGQSCQTELVCQREEPLDVIKQSALMWKYAAQRNIKDTLRTFRLIEQSGACLNSAMYNAVLWAWIKCGNIWAAESWMDEIKEAGVADESTFVILLKALLSIRDLDKAQELRQDMREQGVLASAATFEVMIRGLMRGGCFNEGISLLKEMDAAGVQASSSMSSTIAELMNSARNVNQSFTSIWEILVKHSFDNPKKSADPLQVPCLAAVISQASGATSSAGTYIHKVEIKGTLARLIAVRETLKQDGFLDKSEQDSSALDGHWQADHGLNLIIEGNVINQTTLFSQSMTKPLRDKAQDEAFRAQTGAALKCVSKQGLPMPSMLEDSLLQYLGNELYFVHVDFEINTHRADIFDGISCRHPRIGIRHCWAKPSSGSCGQRALVNGELEADEACFNRHISAV